MLSIRMWLMESYLCDISLIDSLTVFLFPSVAMNKKVVSRDNVSASSVSITQQQQGSLAPRLHRLVPLPPGYAPTHLDTLTLSCDYDGDHVNAGAGGGTRSNRSRHVSTTTTTNATGTTATNSTLPNEQLPQHQPRSTRMYEQCIVTLRNEKDVLAFQVTAFVEPDASSDPAQSGGDYHISNDVCPVMAHI